MQRLRTARRHAQPVAYLFRQRSLAAQFREDAMEQAQKEDNNGIASVEVSEVSPALAPARSVASSVNSQAGVPGCPTCGAVAGVQEAGIATNPYIYALGQIETRFPRPSVEKEMAQAIGRAATAGHTDHRAFYEVLSKRENRYLARQMCWVLSIQGLETYILQPRDPADLDLLINATQPQPTPWISTVIGVRGPIAPPEFCNGLMVPIVAFDQIYSFDRDSLIKTLPKPEKMTPKQFAPAAEEVFARIMQMTDNAGATDEHRALNYLPMRYSGIYAKAAEEFARDFSLAAVEVLPSPLSSTRKIVDAIFSYTNRNTDFTEKFFVRVDVTEEFPFLVTKLSPYYDR